MGWVEQTMLQHVQNIRFYGYCMFIIHTTDLETAGEEGTFEENRDKD